jgi:diguanylate cyclase (GGDEF)-like protein
MWSVLFTTYFLPLRQALMNLLLIAVLYPSIALWVMGPRAITPSVYLVGTSVVTLLIVSSLRRQITGVITAAALEARTDQLTGLANRRSWGEALDRELGRQRRSGGRLCVLVVDLDHFKRLNDTHGHAAGDAALAAIATVLRTHARKSDVLARVGGEEFALLIPDCPVAEGYRRAHEIRLAVERLSGGWITPVTVSVGVAALPDHARTGDELMAAGDIALYQAKRDGRNTVCAYRVETPPGRTSAPTGPAVANADQAG